MKYILLSLIILISFNCYAQKWCAPGAEWTIGWGGVWGYSGYNLISYEKDTIFMGQVCKKLIGRGVQFNEITKVATNFNFTSPLFTYAKSDTVFIYYENEFKAVYFFNAKVGDTLHFGDIMYCDPPLKQLVDSTGTTTINNDTLRFYRVKLLNLPWFIADLKWTIVEKLGCLESNFYPGFICAFDVDAYNLCSYRDNDINWHVSWSNDTCWAFTTTKDIFEESLAIGPNPVFNELRITSSFIDNVESVSIIEINGVMLKNLKRSKGVNLSDIDTAFLQNGLYILQIQTSNGNNYIRKFIKQNKF